MANPPESLVVKIWQYQLLDKTNLITEEGEPIKIIYPGRSNDDRGADLCDAVIATNRGLKKGDIEIHVKSSDWWTHHHYQDPRYNRVILHVVFWCDTEVTIPLQNGEKVATLALHRYINKPAYQWHSLAHLPINLNIPCQQVAERLPLIMLGQVLDKAGEERFLTKAVRFQADLSEIEASQSLYQGIMVALGYAKNKLPFLELARRLPLQALKSVGCSSMSDTEFLAHQQALLLGTAGLLPSQRSLWHKLRKLDDAWIERLEEIWASYRLTKAMSAYDWCLFRVRPSNSPIRRLAAMSHILLRYRERGILEGLVTELMEASVNTGHRGLEKALQVATNGYWAGCFDFGSASKLRMPTLLGGRRAADIIVNVLLPFVFAWGRLTYQPELARKAFNLYCYYPILAVNTLERHMSNQLGLRRNLVNSAQRQQGLIHLYKTRCSQGKCSCCQLNEAGDRPVSSLLTFLNALVTG